MHVSQLLHALLRGPNAKVIETSLPERAPRKTVSEQAALARVASFAPRQQRKGGALLQDLHHGGRCSDLRLRNQQVNVLRHHHLSHDDEPITLAGLFQNREEAVAGARGVEKRQSLVTGTGDKVQVMRTVTAMQAAGHNNSWYGQHRSRPRTKREDGAPTVSKREAKTWKPGPPAQRVARRDISSNAMHYYFSDHLGSHGVIENATATACEQDIDYYPYGGVQSDYCANVAQNYKFTGKERDSESGLDMFGARYYGSSLGRFMTPDWAAAPTAVPYAHYGNPQSLNLYAYVENNPTTTGDPDGHGDAGTFCSAECRARYAQYAAEHPVAATLEPIAEFGTIPTAMVGGAAAWGSALFRNLLGLGLATAPTTVPLINEAIEGLTPGQNATLGRAGALGVSSIEKLGESGFVGSLENGARISAGFEKVGDALGVNISNIQSAARGSVNFNALESGAVNLAKSEGASSLTITATNVTNSKLAQTLEKAGYAAQQVSDNFGRTTVNYVKKICTASGGCQ